MNRYEWIKNMTNDELVRFLLLMGSVCGICSYEKICRKDDIESKFCLSGVNQWLKQEHKND
jgi:hypothetical protein